MIERGNGETENQAKKDADDIRRLFQDRKSLPITLILLGAMPRIILVAVVLGFLRAGQEFSRTRTRPSPRGISE